MKDICQKISNFFPTIGIDSFKQILKDYVLKSRKEETKKDTRFASFPNLVFSYDEICNLVLKDRVSLAINPNILLNVILSNLDKYNRDVHLEVLVDSIKKWKIVQAWKHSIKDAK